VYFHIDDEQASKAPKPAAPRNQDTFREPAYGFDGDAD
jgi:hypothetical protein